MDRSGSSLPFWLAFLTLQEQATRDWLTGLYNRRYFEETLSDHIEAARRYDRKLSLVLFDIDRFKTINDEHGHVTGDDVLRCFGGLLKTVSRKADLPCRYGGDEFAVILPETTREGAEQFVARVQTALAEETGADELPPFTVTAGFAALPSAHLMADADTDLCERKRCS